MMNVLKNIKKAYLYLILDIIFVVLMIFLVKAYIKHLDNASRKAETGTELAFVLNKKEEVGNSFYRANISNDLNSYLDVENTKYNKTIFYKIDKENFEIEFEFQKENDIYVFNIVKIINKDYKINARMNYKGVKYIDYKSGEDATVLRIYTDYDTNYYAMSANGEYFLGDDIDEVVYKNDRFYYISYNKKYESLVGVKKCNKVLSKIEDYSYSDIYYKTGKINFMKEYYQKIYDSSVSVDKYCKSLK